MVARNELMKARETALKMAIDYVNTHGFVELKHIMPIADQFYEFLIAPALPEGKVVASNIKLGTAKV